jgi:hypothetical protein
MATNPRPRLRWAASDAWHWRVDFATNAAMADPFATLTARAGASGEAELYFDLMEGKTTYWQVIGTNGSLTAKSPVIRYLFVPPLGALDLVISEVNWSGVRGTNTFNSGYGEFIEIFNARDFEVSLEGFRLIYINTAGASTNTFLFTRDHRIAAEGFFLVGQTSGHFLTNYILSNTPYWQPTGVNLANDGFSLELKSADGVVLDYVNASPTRGGFTPVGSSATPKKSMERKRPFAAGSLLSSWSAATQAINLMPNIAGTASYGTLATPGTARTEGW